MWTDLLGVAIGGLLGLIAGSYWANRRAESLRRECENLKIECERLKVELRSAQERSEWVHQAQKVLEDTFKALACEALYRNAQMFLDQAQSKLQPLTALTDALDKLNGHIRELESKREGAYSALTEQLKNVAENHKEIQSLTGQLLQALKSPTERGRWGEIQLRRVVEMAGLHRHIDFDEQVSTESGRPDLVVYLPNNGVLIVDAKAPMDAFENALRANSEAERKEYAKQLAQTLLEHARNLGKKRYWEASKTPDFVIMFLPLESCAAVAFEADPDLFEKTWKSNVIIATPTLLFALLKTVAWGWQQHDMVQKAQTIVQEALELFKRFATFSEHFAKLGNELQQAVDAYNSAAASARERLLPLARKFSERVHKEFPEPPTLSNPTSPDLGNLLLVD